MLFRSSLANCSWNGFGCEGSGDCSSYTDETACNGGTYFTGCSGTYDDGSCTGSYEPGLCSGEFDGTAPTIAEETPVTSPTNDTTPNYTFTSDEVGTITYGGSGCGSMTTSAAFGSNTITFSTPDGNALGENTYSCTITVTDASGNVSNTLNVSSFVIDTTAPTTSGAPDMTSDTDAGSSDTDDLTSDNTPTFTGVCTNGNTVGLFNDGSSMGNDEPCLDGNFSIYVSYFFALEDGVNQITFKETDPVGNTSEASDPLSVKIGRASCRERV